MPENNNNTTTNSNSAYTATANQISSGLLIQQYCNTVIAQPKVDFSADDNLIKLQNDINTALSNAANHANKYLTTICPRIFSCLSDLDNYFSIYQAVPVACPQGSTVEQWVSTLTMVKTISENNKRNVVIVINYLKTLTDDFKDDATTFDGLATQINNQINGDNGELEKMKTDLKNIDDQIAGISVGVAFGALTILGGVFTIVVGAAADFVTAGTSSELVIGGVCTVVAGVGSEVGLAITLNSLLNQKNSILTEQSKIKEEVTLITGFNSALDSLSTQAKNAYEAAQEMEASWSLLSSDVESLIDDLQSGIITTDNLRANFLNEANNDIANIKTSITTIKTQMAGVTITKVPAGTTLNNFINNLN